MKRAILGIHRKKTQAIVISLLLEEARGCALALTWPDWKLPFFYTTWLLNSGNNRKLRKKKKKLVAIILFSF